MRKKRTETFGELKVIIEQLPPMRALEALPEVLAMFMPVISGLKNIKGALTKGKVFTIEDAMTLAPALEGLVDSMAFNRRLIRLAPALLSCSTVIIPDHAGKGQPLKYELSNPDMIDVAFSDYVGKLIPVLRLAVEVTFKDFLDELGLFVGATPTPSA